MVTVSLKIHRWSALNCFDISLLILIFDLWTETYFDKYSFSNIKILLISYFFKEYFKYFKISICWHFSRWFGNRSVKNIHKHNSTVLFAHRTKHFLWHGFQFSKGSEAKHKYLRGQTIAKPNGKPNRKLHYNFFLVAFGGQKSY